MICISAVQVELNELVAAVDRDILRPVAQLNFGRPPMYEVRPRSLLETFNEQRERQVMPSRQQMENEPRMTT